MNTVSYRADAPLGGHWMLALIMIVVGLWIIFRYLAPRGWKEWRNAGIIQAFVIALYAEMYGFPLTIYLLTSFLDVDIPWLHSKGHLWATLLGLGETGAMVEMFLGLGIVIMGITLVFRGWHLIYEAQGKSKLVTEGVYRYMRHPQYTGIFMALFGQLIHWPTLLTFLFFPVIVLAYFGLARKEERAMLSAFGEDYRNYMQNVPMFFPKMGQWRDALGV